MALPSVEKQFADALKSIARNLEIKEYVQQSTELYPIAIESLNIHPTFMLPLRI
ncbi:hypothetical protein IJ22_13270 [Paenibacillus naphthalenovorans]|uniref:Uncharacterized protein n=1 Tax=Paenibacillus naphthalenovorans TaxID=162209 RepID=A0A0U2VQA8_9BACL|nr:hypothetical protein IJ22_13270 [Paenibacillus naphthalenovorans]SDI89140.1 hypothetical protein SAMN05421868_11296 [Paenibacillus naphthalenovorans]